MSTPAKLIAAVLDALAEQHGNESITPKQFELITNATLFLSAAFKGGNFEYKGYAYNRLAVAFDDMKRAMPPEPTEVCPD